MRAASALVVDAAVALRTEELLAVLAEELAVSVFAFLADHDALVKAALAPAVEHAVALHAQMLLALPAPTVGGLARALLAQHLNSVHYY